MEQSRSLDPETIARVEQGLAQLDDPTSEVSKRYRESQAKWDEIIRPFLEAIRRSESIGPEDLRIVINVR